MPAKRKPNLLLECTRCEARVSAEYIAEYEAYDPQEEIPYRYYFAKCPSCGEPFVAISGNYGDHGDERHWDTPSRYLPTVSHLEWKFPKDISSAFGEANACFKAKAYTASAVMCRKTLEGICAAHGVKGRNLATSLKKMKEANVIDQRLFTWADQLRISGNEAAHGVTTTFSEEDSQDILDFTLALLEYVFTFRDKFEQFKKRRSK